MISCDRAALGAAGIEVINDDLPPGPFRHALFDFDGTISLIRTGWQDVMIPMMVDILAATPAAESRDRLSAHVREYVDRLTGKQTIYQMIQLADEVRARGGEPLDPLEYKHIYHQRLMARIAARRKGLAGGSLDPEELMLPRTRDLLTALRERGCRLYLASGTDEAYVREEAEALGVTEFFDGGVWGALDDYKRFSKAIVIEQILTTHEIDGCQLVAFGDGFVEIENTKQVGGLAIGVASDEVRRCGVNEWKRRRLIDAGADIVIPEYRRLEALMMLLFGSDSPAPGGCPTAAKEDSP